MSELPEEIKNLIQKAVNENPELVEKFGNPLDLDDPRNWTPTKRAEEGLSVEEQLRLLGLDVESQATAVASLIKRTLEAEYQLEKLQKWVAQKMVDEFAEKVKADPDRAVELFQEVMSSLAPDTVRGAWGPLEDKPDASVRYAGSAKGIAPDQMVETPNGIIRADEIPGYRNDPEWSPSPDWAEANCMCPQHVHAREQEAKNQFGIDPFNDNPGTGFYL
jgi:hypothetical protein